MLYARGYSKSLMQQNDQKADQRRLRTLGWMVLGAAVGVSSAVALELPERQLLFFTVLGAGAALLVRVNAAGQTRQRLQPVAIPARASSTAAQEIQRNPKLFDDGVEVLSPEEARQARDDFLTEHQK